MLQTLCALAMPGGIFPVQVTTVLNTTFYRFRPGKLHTRSIKTSRMSAQLVDCGEDHFIPETKPGVQALPSSQITRTSPVGPFSESQERFPASKSTSHEYKCDQLHTK
jgi:hypothetical protein